MTTTFMVAHTIRLTLFARWKELEPPAWSAPPAATSACPSWSRAPCRDSLRRRPGLAALGVLFSWIRLQFAGLAAFTGVPFYLLSWPILLAMMAAATLLCALGSFSTTRRINQIWTPMVRAATLLLACLLAVWSGQAAAAGQGASTLTIGWLQEEIRSHEDLPDQSGDEERSLLDQLARLDGDISRQQSAIRDIQARIQAQDEVLAAKEGAELATIRANKTLQDHLMKRLRAFYLMGPHGVLNVAFPAAPCRSCRWSTTASARWSPTTRRCPRPTGRASPPSNARQARNWKRRCTRKFSRRPTASTGNWPRP